MTAKIIDGKAISKSIRAEWKVRVKPLVAQGNQPGLAVIIVSDHPASKIYVKNKILACHEVGIYSMVIELPGDISEKDLMERLQQLNSDPDIHGILVQLPLPSHINTKTIIENIAVEKDVDGFHIQNMGALVSSNTTLPPCTPAGVKCLLERLNILIEGKHAVVVGRSYIVGKPMALMLLDMNATVSICSSKTQNLSSFTSSADILVVATGRPEMITADMVKKGAVVIDVGINRLDDGRIVGDVDFEDVRTKASQITPVPGGVGPMTITSLITNTIEAAIRANSLKLSLLVETG